MPGQRCSERRACFNGSCLYSEGLCFANTAVTAQWSTAENRTARALLPCFSPPLPRIPQLRYQFPISPTQSSHSDVPSQAVRGRSRLHSSTRPRPINPLSPIITHHHSSPLPIPSSSPRYLPSSLQATRKLQDKTTPCIVLPAPAFQAQDSPVVGKSYHVPRYLRSLPACLLACSTAAT